MQTEKVVAYTYQISRSECLHLQGQEEEEQFDSFTYQISSEEQDAKELQEEVLGEQ